MDQPLHRVSNLSLPTRSVVEGLLGHPLQDDQQVFIAAVGSQVSTSPQKLAAWDELLKISAEAQSRAEQDGRPASDSDSIIDEACNDVRYGD